MPYHLIDSRRLFLHDKCLIIDTNLLTSAFVSSEKNHANAREFLDNLYNELDFIIPIEVLIEAWGLIAGKSRNLDIALDLYDWVSQTEKATVVYLGNDFYTAGKSISREIKVDIVDSILIHSSQRLASVCRLTNPIPIATYETRDYLKYVRTMHSRREHSLVKGKLVLWNPLSYEPNEFEF